MAGQWQILRPTIGRPFVGKPAWFFSMPPCWDRLTIEENVALPLLEVDGLRLEAVRDRVIAALDTMLLPGAEICICDQPTSAAGCASRLGLRGRLSAIPVVTALR